MTIWHRKVTTDIEGRLSRPALQRLFADWRAARAQAAVAAQDGSLPALDPFVPSAWPELAANLMLLQNEGNDFHYRHYGSEIARTAGFDMTGRLVSSFGGEVAQYFIGCYRETLASGAPLYAVHYSDRASTVFSWERLILPLHDAAGCAWLLVHNAPLEDRHTLLGSVLNASSEAVLALRALRDVQGRQVDWAVVMLNDALVQLAGKATPTPLGRPVGEALLRWHDLGLAPLCDAVLASRQRRDFSATILVRGEQREFDGEATPLDDGCVLRLLDVSAARQQQRALEQREAELRLANERLREANTLADAANRAKSAFLATMSHEIRTPMNGVMGMAQLLALGPLLPSQAEKVRVIQESALALLRVIDDVLDFSKIEAGRVDIEQAPFDAAALAASVCLALTPVAQDQRVELHLDAPAAMPLLLGDAGRVRQVLMNLVGNAIKFSAGRPQTRGRVRVQTELRADGLHIAVADNGIGIDTAAQVRLFQPFMQAEADTTRRFGGTGLGLAICKRLVDLMGGRIGVHSAAGEGARFDVCLPLPRAPDAVLQPPAPAALPLAAVRGARILVAEDDRINQQLIAQQLGLLGYRFEIADDGEQALALWRQGAHDLVLTDQHMPVLDGYGLVGAIRLEAASRGAPPPPIVMLSANAVQGEANRAAAVGVDKFLTKPVDLPRLSQVLAHCLQARPGTD